MLSGRAISPLLLKFNTFHKEKKIITRTYMRNYVLKGIVKIWLGLGVAI